LPLRLFLKALACLHHEKRCSTKRSHQARTEGLARISYVAIDLKASDELEQHYGQKNNHATDKDGGPRNET
jgi:hypothetical protein